VCPLNSWVLFPNTDTGGALSLLYCPVYSRIRKWGPGSRLVRGASRAAPGLGFVVALARARMAIAVRRCCILRARAAATRVRSALFILRGAAVDRFSCLNIIGWRFCAALPATAALRLRRLATPPPCDSATTCDSAAATPLRQKVYR
jgi:hypothetical protein